MAKREIKRTEDAPVPEVKEAAKPQAPAVVKIPEAKQEDGVITVKAPAVVIIRVLKGVCIYQEKFKTRRIPIDSSKPVTVRIAQ
jgi:hypothetical protein